MWLTAVIISYRIHSVSIIDVTKQKIQLWFMKTPMIATSFAH